MSDRRTEVVCDTTAYLPADLAASRNIHLISLYVGPEGDLQPESEISEYGAFFERLRNSESRVTTSQPSVGDFVEVYEPLLASGAEVVSVHISANISGTCGAAAQARRRLVEDDKGGERIQIVDSRTGAGGLAFCVLAAAAAADAGAGADEAALHAEEARAEQKIWFAVETLEFLRRGGRIGRAQELLGSTLQIKPILTMEEEITPVERVRTRRRVLERLRHFARERHQDGADAWIVQHVRDPESAAALVEDCRAIFGRDPVLTSEIGPVLGAHVGPGLLGIGSVPESVLEA